MAERTQRAPRGRLAFALMPLAALPGCVIGELATTELWRGYAWPEPVVQEQLLDRQTTQVDGSLLACAPVLENGLLWCDGPQPEPGRWWLSPKTGAEAGAEVAAALFADPDFCVVHSAAIDAVRRYAVGEVVDNEAMLELDLRLHDGALGRAVSTTVVSPAAARMLATPRRNAYMLIADPGTSLPAVYLRCAERLAAVDLRRIAGEQFEVHAESWVFVDADGRPAFGLGDDEAALPPAAYDENAPLADRLTALRELSLLVRVRTGSESTILRVRPDRLWLSSELQVDGERCVHRSSWYLQATQHPIAAARAVDVSRIVSTLRLQEEYYQRSFHPVLVDGDLLARVALTPVTLALDLVLGPGAGDLLRWIAGTDPKPYVPRERGR